jgi:hypothetical protein
MLEEELLQRTMFWRRQRAREIEINNTLLQLKAIILGAAKLISITLTITPSSHLFSFPSFCCHVYLITLFFVSDALPESPEEMSEFSSDTDELLAAIERDAKNMADRFLTNSDFCFHLINLFLNLITSPISDPLSM